MYANPNAWSRMQQHCIAINGTYFNTHRMLAQYFTNSYFPQADLNATALVEPAPVRLPEPVLV
jgi:starch phosphorylase